MSKSHYTPRLVRAGMPGAAYREHLARAKAAGFDTGKLFVFEDGNDAQEAEAKTAASAYAKEWQEKLGHEVVVCLGFFL